MSDSNCASLNFVKRGLKMEMPNQDLINMLVKYNGVFNYDDYTKIVNDNVFENEKVFIFNDYANAECVLLFLMTKYPEMIDTQEMQKAIYDNTKSLLSDIIKLDIYDQFIVDSILITHTYNYDGVEEKHQKLYSVVKKSK